MKTRSILGAALSLSIGLALTGGCSSNSSGNGGSGSGSGGGDSGSHGGVGEHDAVKVTAAAGGTISGTGAAAVIPAGALASDATITIDIKDKSGYSGASNIAVNVFEFGPSGTKFSKPVAMTLDLGGATAPSGKTPVIAYFDGTTWQPLADSAVSGGKVTATTTHFTPFTIVWSNGMQTGGGCAALDFTPCGGSLAGTWSFTAGCFDLAPGTGDPTGGKCPQTVTTATVDLTGTVTFNADGTYSESDTTSASVTFDVPGSCLGGASCASLKATDDGKGGCTLTQTQAPSASSSAGSYTTTGTALVTTKMQDGGAGTPDSPVDYCVSGTTLKVKGTDSKGTKIYVATKQ